MTKDAKISDLNSKEREFKGQLKGKEETFEALSFSIA
jgi:hypothetical protein